MDWNALAPHTVQRKEKEEENNIYSLQFFSPVAGQAREKKACFISSNAGAANCRDPARYSSLSLDFSKSHFAVCAQFLKDVIDQHPK